MSQRSTKVDEWSYKENLNDVDYYPYPSKVPDFLLAFAALGILSLLFGKKSNSIASQVSYYFREKALGLVL